MGKEIILPWSCEAQDKVLKELGRVLAGLALGGFPTLFIFGFIVGVYTVEGGLLVINGGVFTFVSWMIYLTIGEHWPNLKCRCDKKGRTT